MKHEAARGEPVASSDESGQRTSTQKDNWLGFVGDVSKFTGEVRFKSLLRIDGHFSGRVTSSDGTLVVSFGAQVTQAVINVAVAKISGTVEGDINASKELLLGRTAHVRGNVSTRALIVEEGALFNGLCRRFESSLNRERPVAEPARSTKRGK
jgi:cytoskeletal protein CcmA (bactofilin family)